MYIHVYAPHTLWYTYPVLWGMYHAVTCILSTCYMYFTVQYFMYQVLCGTHNLYGGIGVPCTVVYIHVPKTLLDT